MGWAPPDDLKNNNIKVMIKPDFGGSFGNAVDSIKDSAGHEHFSKALCIIYIIIKSRKGKKNKASRITYRPLT